MVGGRIIVPHRRRILRAGAVAGGLWADWDEASEDTLFVDQDGDGTEDTFICFFENTSAGGDETGRGGGLSGADLVLTQVGGIAGASGSPPRRELDDTAQTFTGTHSLFNTVIKDAAEWTYLVKVYITTRGQIFNWYRNTAPTEQLYSLNAGNKQGFFIRTNGTLRMNSSTTNDIPLSTLLWVGMWYDGTTVYGGFTDSGSGTGGQPTKLSDFAAGDRVSTSTANGVFLNDADTHNYALGRASSSFLGYGYYALMSNVCLIDNAS